MDVVEFDETVRRRRMVRRFEPGRKPSRADLNRLLETAVRAPSAGFSQGWHFLVLDDETGVDGYWAATAPTDTDAWLTGMRTAPALIVVFSERRVYEERYARADKGQRPGVPIDLDQRWPVPYWHLDAAMAALLILLAAVDTGFGAAFFGVPTDRVEAVRARFAVPNDLVPVGTVAVGYPDPGYRSSAVTRRPMADVVSYGCFGGSA